MALLQNSKGLRGGSALGAFGDFTLFAYLLWIFLVLWDMLGHMSQVFSPL